MVPERKNDLERLWRKYTPTFNILTEIVARKKVLMQSGAFNIVEFGGYAQRAFWLGPFIAWEAHRPLGLIARVKKPRFDRVDHLYRAFCKIRAVDDPRSIAMPEGVPEPECFAYLKGDQKLIADVAAFAIGWALLHEVGHLKYKHEGTASSEGDSNEKRHREELLCDSFATSYILERAGEFAHAENLPPNKVRRKREMGIYAALFVLALDQAGSWEESESHPALQTRIDATVELIGGSGRSASDTMARNAFGALRDKWPHAPGPSWPRHS